VSGEPLQRMWSGSSIRPLAFGIDDPRSSGTATGRMAGPSSRLRVSAIGGQSTGAAESVQAPAPAQRPRTERTADGHQRTPPRAVGVPSELKPSAICLRLIPASRALRIRSTTSGAAASLRPRSWSRRVSFAASLGYVHRRGRRTICATEGISLWHRQARREPSSAREWVGGRSPSRQTPTRFSQPYGNLYGP
jgi:hypothetical protein